MGLVAKHIDFTFPVVGRERAVPVWAISLYAVAVVLSDELNLVCAGAANCYSYTYVNKNNACFEQKVLSCTLARPVPT